MQSRIARNEPASKRGRRYSDQEGYNWKTASSERRLVFARRGSKEANLIPLPAPPHMPTLVVRTSLLSFAALPHGHSIAFTSKTEGETPSQPA